ncbi:uncharacterized protein E5676_scaffold519G00300 [Cucumis melo var. makuwa]|uniref:Integrase catalytic domain-containing protein n=1 Tax=Cucumis melo var. makuwa TaxID=1194695 RepID=A0A5D3DA16_CUCMM|nr:uncharacterized protein E6C27_scaffold24G003320 [Cucumis melo var. makuwa]TYK20403.1 uncharacterized protein E5676_scaffold519G00300 [Cucumis melo var. makuwa]
MCLILFFAIDKLRRYMQAFTIHLVAKADPVKYILSRSIISRHLAKWAIILQQYDIVYIPQKAVKGQALANFLADHPVPSNWKLCDVLDEEVLFVESIESWIMFFDGAARRSEDGVSIVFISLEKYMLSYSFTLGKEESTNDLEEAHSGICGAHQSGPKLQHQLKIMGYYWPTMIHDSMHFAKYGIPHCIVTDNGRQFANTLIDKLCEKFNFKQYKSSMYNAAANGLVEAFNKALYNLLKNVASKTKRD